MRPPVVSVRTKFLDASGIAVDVCEPSGNMLENGGAVVGGLLVKDSSSLGNDDASVSSWGRTGDVGVKGVKGVKGGVDAIVIDEAEVVRCLLERDDDDNKFAVDIDDMESRL